MDSSIKETIERLRDVKNQSIYYDATDVVRAFMGRSICSFGDATDFRKALIDTLSQCDPDLWSDEFLADNGMMRLPVDADGQYVHIDDEMVDTCGDTFTVDAIGSHTLFYYDGETDTVEWTRATNKRHHNPDTWEKIIEDALGHGSYYSECDVKRLVIRCRALAGGVQ